MKIAIGADHAGFELKEKVKQHLIEQGYQVDDNGTVSNQSVDYPDFAKKVGEEVAHKQADLGVLVCGTGIGMAISANKVPGIRAANVTSEFEAQMLREHNNGNVITLGARVVDANTAVKLVDKFLATNFAGGRHQERVDKIMDIERDEECVPTPQADGAPRSRS
jgi:ribose 5-phosphate isomerase B